MRRPSPSVFDVMNASVKQGDATDANKILKFTANLVALKPVGVLGPFFLPFVVGFSVFIVVRAIKSVERMDMNLIPIHETVFLSSLFPSMRRLLLLVFVYSSAESFG